MQLLYLKNAELSVALFVGDESEDTLIAESARAVDCLDCEAYLQAGIEAYRAIERADMALRTAILRGKLELDNLDEFIETLLKRWLKSQPKAFAWIERCRRNGYDLDNVEEFMECLDQAIAIVEFDPESEMGVGLKELRDKAVLEHRNGETVDCFSGEE